MEEDDIFQVDKADLIQGPTLAELNANDESLLTDFNFDDFLLPAQQQLQSMVSRNRSTIPSNVRKKQFSQLVLIRGSKKKKAALIILFLADCRFGSISNGGSERCIFRFTQSLLL